MEAGIAELPIAKTALSTKNESSAKESSPFDATRDGFVMSEDAGILILESLSHAKRRGSSIYAEVVGYGGKFRDLSYSGDPSRESGSLPRHEAAGIETNDIDVISAHATNMIVGDQSEIRTIKKLFEEHANALPVDRKRSRLRNVYRKESFHPRLILKSMIPCATWIM